MSAFGKRNVFALVSLQEQERSVMQHFHGAVAGVNFDLRHPDLSPDDWTCPSFLIGASRFHVVEDDLDDDTPTLLGLVGELARARLTDAREKGLDILVVGDTVKAVSVLIHRVNEDPLVPDPDRDVAGVFLEITHPDGTRTPLATPLLFWPRGSWTTQDPPTSETLSRLAQRLGRVSGANEDEVAELAYHYARVTGLKHRIEEALWAARRPGTGSSS